MSTIISVISLFIAAISAMFTGLNFYSNRAVLIKFGEDDNHPLPVVENEIYAYSGKQTAPFNNGIMFHFQILNPSPKDIAYFNMHFVSDGRIAQVWTMKSFGYMEKEPKIIMTDPIKGKGEINIPYSTQGTFKAHSFTPMYVFMSTDEFPFPQKVSFQFNYSVRHFPFIGKKSYYKKFSINLDLTNVESGMKSKQKVMKQLTLPVQKLLKPNQTPPYSKRRKHNRRKK